MPLLCGECVHVTTLPHYSSCLHGKIDGRGQLAVHHDLLNMGLVEPLADFSWVDKLVFQNDVIHFITVSYIIYNKLVIMYLTARKAGISADAEGDPAWQGRSEQAEILRGWRRFWQRRGWPCRLFSLPQPDAFHHSLGRT